MRLLKGLAMFATAVSLAALLARSNAGSVQAQAGQLFVAADPALTRTSPPGDPDLRIRRSRLARVDVERLTTARVESGRGGPTRNALVLNLFDDVVFNSIIEHTSPTSSGYSLSGRLENVPLGTVTLVVNGTLITGTVRTPLAIYTIRPAPFDGLYVIAEIDESALPPEGKPLVSSPAGRFDPITPILPPSGATEFPLASADPPIRSDDGSRVDVFVVYTAAARNGEGGKGAIEALIDLMVAETNQAYRDGGVVHRINLVARREVTYTEAGDYLTDLNRLTRTADGYMDDVHTLREQYAADLVHLVVKRDPWDVCGVAWLLSTSDTAAMFAPWGFGLTDYRCRGATFAHELGHNMGVAHDRYHWQKEGYDLTRDSYGYGYVNQRAFSGGSSSSRWRTIMAGDSQCTDAGFSCTRVLRFSNPDQRHQGDALGVGGDGPSSSVGGPSDARRRLNNTRTTVANLAVGPCLLGQAGPQVRLQASSGQYVAAEQGGGSSVNASRGAAGPWETFRLMSDKSGCLRSGDSVSIRTDRGFYLRAERGGGSTLDATALAAGSWEKFTIHRRGGGILLSGDAVAVRASSGHYVVAEGGGEGALNADRTGQGGWETFTMKTVN